MIATGGMGAASRRARAAGDPEKYNDGTPPRRLLAPATALRNGKDMTKGQNPPAQPVCDAITLELITGALGMAVTEMATLLERTAMSPFIREKKDFHVALADAEGKVIVASGGATGEFMSTVFERFPAEEMGPGDIYWYNDCYGSRGIVSHSPDQVFVAPVYFEGKLIGFSQCWAHFNDIGGMHPGTISPDATSIYQEGIIVPVVRLQHRGRRNDDLQYMFERNSRYPNGAWRYPRVDRGGGARRTETDRVVRAVRRRCREGRAGSVARTHRDAAEGEVPRAVQRRNLQLLRDRGQRR
jgi:hypothetical protein